MHEKHEHIKHGKHEKHGAAHGEHHHNDEASSKPPIIPALTLVGTSYLAGLENQVAQSSQHHDKLLRSAADLENYKKRARQEKEDAVKFANESLIEQLLPVLDSFDLGMEAAANATDAAAIAQGMKMAVAQLFSVLRQVGVEPIDAKGQKFDPNWHDAVSEQENTEVEEGMVLHQLRKGFKLKGRLLRPASVMVAKSPGQASE